MLDGNFCNFKADQKDRLDQGICRPGTNQILLDLCQASWTLCKTHSPFHLLLKPLKDLSAAADTSWQGRSMFLQSDKQAECVGRLPAQGLFHCPVTRGATHSMAMNWKKPHQNCLTLRLWKPGSTIYCIRSAPAQRCRPHSPLLCLVSCSTKAPLVQSQHWGL